MGEYGEQSKYKVRNKIWLDGMNIWHAYIQGKEEILGKINEVPIPFEEGTEWESFEGFKFRIEDHRIIKIFDPTEDGNEDEEDLLRKWKK